MKLVIKTPFVSTNALYTNSKTTGKRILTDKARISKETIAWEAKAEMKGQKMFTGPIRVELYLFFPTKHRRDLDNVKSFIDAMSKVCYKDDSQIYELVIRKYHDKENPRVEVIIQKL